MIFMPYITYVTSIALVVIIVGHLQYCYTNELKIL